MTKMITTTDNPYNPLTNYDEWFLYDLRMGYRTCERLAASAYYSDRLTDAENKAEMDRAYDILLQSGAIGKDGKIVAYKIVTEE